jgi:hypothetical protein
MLKYLSVFLMIIIIIYLARNRIIEPLGPIIIRDESSNIETEDKNDTEVYITNNQINYDKLDSSIEEIIRQHQLLEYNINNFQFKQGYVDNNLYQNEDPIITIGGSYPRNIQLNFAFPPPLPGGAGPKGDKGDKGPKGQQGPKGNRGILGGNNYC